MKKLITFALVCLFGVALTLTTTGCPKSDTKKTETTTTTTEKSTKS